LCLYNFVRYLAVLFIYTHTYAPVLG
jgi:hypothetical protein